MLWEAFGAKIIPKPKDSMNSSPTHLESSSKMMNMENIQLMVMIRVNMRAKSISCISNMNKAVKKKSILKVKKKVILEGLSLASMKKEILIII